MTNVFMCLEDSPDAVIEVSGGSFRINIAGLLDLSPDAARTRIVAIRNDLSGRFERLGTSLDFNTSTYEITATVMERMALGQLGQRDLDNIRRILAYTISAFVKQIRSNYVTPNWDRILPAPGESLLRYGLVELRVLENYLLEPERLQAACAQLVPALDSEELMYAPGAASNFLAADDVAWNVRMLMTNAGFYSEPDADSMWKSLSEWCQAYWEALAAAHWIEVPTAYPFAYSIQSELLARRGKTPRYFRFPQPFDLYGFFADKRVCVASPLAGDIVDQYESGRLFDLFLPRSIPRFSVCAVEAPVSTYPNRPGSSWSESFAALCRAVDEQFRTDPPDVFLAACGCYGLPICEYARKRHGAASIYLGNVTHAYFGILQQSSMDFHADKRYQPAWIARSLGHLKNVHRIDNGRYT